MRRKKISSREVIITHTFLVAINQLKFSLHLKEKCSTENCPMILLNWWWLDLTWLTWPCNLRVKFFCFRWITETNSSSLSCLSFDFMTRVSVAPMSQWGARLLSHSSSTSAANSSYCKSPSFLRCFLKCYYKSVDRLSWSIHHHSVQTRFHIWWCDGEKVEEQRKLRERDICKLK